MSAAISLGQLSKRCGDMVSVDNLTFTVEKGEVFGLLGPNGSGKTTTLNMVCGLIRPTAGTVLLHGLNPWQDAKAVRALLGVVPQETALYEDLNAYENLDFQYALYGRDLSRRREVIAGVLDLMGLTDRARSRVGTYSGGMKRRLALARALLHDPEVLLLDEPTLGVDVQSTHALWDHVRALRGRGKTVVVTTNVMAEADYLCDRLAIIDHGRLLALDTPANLKASIAADCVVLDLDPVPEGVQDLLRLDPTVQVEVRYGAGTGGGPHGGPGQVEVRLSGAAERAQQLLEALRGRCTVRRLEMRTPTLDDVFLSYTGRKLRD
ncbi:MAG: ABC transporter ATP-binding protein [Symbiobacteriia bacterium]